MASVTDPYGRILGFLDRLTAYMNLNELKYLRKGKFVPLGNYLVFRLVSWSGVRLSLLGTSTTI
jgi:hypothetical protein